MFLKYLDLQLIKNCTNNGTDSFVNEVRKESMLGCSLTSSEKSSSLAQSCNQDDVIIKHFHCPVDRIDAPYRYHLERNDASMTMK